jgi:hypothetical protein
VAATFLGSALAIDSQMLESLLVFLLEWMTGFEFHLTPPIIKEIKHFRMQTSEKRGKLFANMQPGCNQGVGYQRQAGA